MEPVASAFLGNATVCVVRKRRALIKNNSELIVYGPAQEITSRDALFLTRVDYAK